VDPAAPTLRLFVALALPPAVADTLATLTEPLRGFAWVAPERLHLTLRFLGDVPARQIDSLVAALSSVRVAPFQLPLEGLGTFPPRGAPQVLWAGVGAGHPRLHQLRQQVDDSVLHCGIAADLRRFTPHITLARCGGTSPAAVRAWLHRHREWVGPAFRVEAFRLYASELRPGGAVHTAVAAFPLAPTAAAS
jgi:2'-5' RNA ligase